MRNDQYDYEQDMMNHREQGKEEGIDIGVERGIKIRKKEGRDDLYFEPIVPTAI